MVHVCSIHTRVFKRVNLLFHQKLVVMSIYHKNGVNISTGVYIILIAQNSQWTCKQRMKCPSADCKPEHILFSEDGCCPVCARQALKNVMCETFP